VKKYFTKRMLFSVAGLSAATWLCHGGHIDGSAWTYALGVSIFGHHAEDIVKAYKGDRPPC